MKDHTTLAERLRPTILSEICGQSHLIGPGKPLTVAFEAKKPHSMILWGPPGVGKTSIARMASQVFDCQWVELSAVFSGVKDIRAAIELAEKHIRMGQKTILFIDEIHRFNKAQQDALLAHTESGLFTLIGATTENPSFEVNRALLSRTQVYVLKPLTSQELGALLQRASHQLKLQFAENAAEILVCYADGDARRLLNMIEQMYSYTQSHGIHMVSQSLVEQILSNAPKRFDKGGDHFYDQISALHKSVRGSNPDAALYWLCLMLEGGADPLYLSRRIVRMAWEDIGLADPKAMQIANDAASTYERLGPPEGELALAQAVIYLSVAPKSNAGYRAYQQARAFVKQYKSREVPIHLRNAPTTLAKKIGYGKAYRYAHDEPHGYAAGENYFPDGMQTPNWYQPVHRGLEVKIAEKLAFLRQLDKGS